MTHNGHKIKPIRSSLMTTRRQDCQRNCSYSPMLKPSCFAGLLSFFYKNQLTGLLRKIYTTPCLLKQPTAIAMYLISFNSALSHQYKSLSQRAGALSEDWVKNQCYCPSCGNDRLSPYKKNHDYDFFCEACKDNYELKATKGKIGKSISDGAYYAKIRKLQSKNNPHLFVMQYDAQRMRVENFFIIPQYFFTANIIEKRKKLKKTARRAGWVGSNILIAHVPPSGRIFLVKDGMIIEKSKVIADWHKTRFLKSAKQLDARGWLIDTMSCIEKLQKREFTLHDIYQFEEELKVKHPKNKFIKAKLRQQLQLLRDKHYVLFVGHGQYRLR